MIGLIVYDGHCTIKLFYKDQPHHLVGEGHLGKRNFFVCSSIHFLGETIWTPHYEDKPFWNCVCLFFYVQGKLGRGILFRFVVK